MTVTWTVRHGDYAVVLDEFSADLVFESPPYNIGSRSPRIDGNRRHGKFDPKSYGAVTGYPDSLPEDVYQASQRDHFLWVADHLNPGGIFAYNHKPRRSGRMIHPAEWFLLPEVRERLTLMEEVIWDRGSTHNHSPAMMWPTTERVYVFRRTEDTRAGQYGIRQGEHLDYRSDVWRIPLRSRDAQTKGHNVPMRPELAENVIKAWSQEGDTVMCPYSGSGTVGVAAVGLGRNFVGAELMRDYYEIAARNVRAAADHAQGVLV